jgi:serine/threonine protein kinase
LARENITAVARELGFTEEQLPLVQELVRQAIQVTDDLITRVGPIEPDSRRTQADWVDPPAEPGSPPSQPHPDRYEDIGLLGIGGMGEVRRVRDRTLNRTLAMKVLKPGLANRPQVLDRFLEEAQATAQLQHSGPSRLPDRRLRGHEACRPGAHPTFEGCAGEPPETV